MTRPQVAVVVAVLMLALVLWLALYGHQPYDINKMR